MRFFNEWNANAKQGDKVGLEFRLGKVTVFCLRFDTSNSWYKLTLLNFYRYQMKQIFIYSEEGCPHCIELKDSFK